MKGYYRSLLALLLVLGACNSEHASHSLDETDKSQTVSLYQKNQGLLLPEEIRAKLGVTLKEIEEESFPGQGGSSPPASIAIPESAVIQGVQGDFVYVENGEHLVRTPVVPGAKHDGWIEITDGLLPGDKVVTKAAHDLWMIELLALRGGSPCCPVPRKVPKG